MAEPARRYLTFRAAGRLYALPAEEIAEVIRLPAVARVPQSPESLMGLANLRGSVLPVASLSRLLGREESKLDGASRAIVLRSERPVALVVERVEALVAIDTGQIEIRQAQLASESAERITGAFLAAGGDDIAKVLDVGAMLAGAFVARPRSRSAGGAAGAVRAPAAQDSHRGETLVTFDVPSRSSPFSWPTSARLRRCPNALRACPRARRSC
jgi:purine-binding chemotaxis protein CheW